MKKIFFAIFAIFGLWSCVQEDLPVVGPGTHDSEGGYVDITFGVVVPEMQDATRTMSEPAIKSLHLLVFDDNGLLSEAVDAELESTEWGETSALTYYKATLARTDYKRTIHFVANSPYSSVNDYPMSTESSLMTTMAVSGEQDAYWQRVELPYGITGTQSTDANGQVIYVPTDEVKTALSEVPLVRNHSRVKVVNALTADKKQLNDIEFVLVNIPHSGTVAPFNINNGQFVSYTAATNYDTLVANNYQGYEPTGRDLINNTFTSGALVCENNTAWVAEGGYHYLYERKQNIEPAYVIVRGRYDDDTNLSYYKIDIINDKGVSYNLLRNIEYTVNITNVLGSGFATAEEAYNAGPSNNLNFSVETKNLLNLSDGTSALYVEYTQKVINTSAATVTLRYRYITNLANGTNDTDAVTIEYEQGDVIASAINEGDDTTTADGWNTLSFTAGTVPAVGESAKSQTITLRAGSFARQVEFILTNPYRLILDMPNKVGEDLGSAVNASLILEERLPYGIFPLEFIVVAENNSLSPDARRNELPVVTNVNLYGEPGGNYFGYKVTLDWDKYHYVDGVEDKYNTTIPLYFTTNMAQSSPIYGVDEDGIDCYAYNQYHNIANDDYWISVLYTLGLELANSSVGYGVGRSVTATLRLPEAIADADWTNGEYLDFVISDSNSTLSLTNVVGGLKIGDNVVRVMKSTFDGGTRAITLTFTTTKVVSATSIIATNDNFKQASATLSNSLYNFTAININGSTQRLDIEGDGQDVKVNVTLPADIPESIFGENGLVLTLTATQNTLDADNGTSGSGRTFTKTVTYTEYTASKTVTFDFTTNSNNVATSNWWNTTAKTTTITVSNEYFNDSDSRSFRATEL